MKWPEHEYFSNLSALELRVAGAAAQGLSDKSIAIRLDLGSRAAVGRALSRVYEKLGFGERDDVNKRARLAHLVTWCELDRKAAPK